MDDTSGQAAGKPGARVRDGLVVALTLTTGAVDACAFLALGKVFSSVITGNLVLLGVGAGNRSGSEVIHAAVALAGYCAGVLIGARVAAQGSTRQQTWPPAVTAAIAVELCLLAAFSAGWELAPVPARTGAQLALLSLLAAAMGIQSAAVRRLGEMSSTYLTSTLTGVVAGLATSTRPAGLGRSIGALSAIVVGALIGALLIRSAPAWLPAAVLLPCATVAAIALASSRRPV